MYPYVSLKYFLPTFIALSSAQKLWPDTLCTNNQYRTVFNDTFNVHCGLKYEAPAMRERLEITTQYTLENCAERCSRYNQEIPDDAHSQSRLCNGVVHINETICYLKNDMLMGQDDVWFDEATTTNSAIRYDPGTEGTNCPVDRNSDYTEPAYNDKYVIKCHYELGPLFSLGTTNGTHLSDCIPACSAWNRHPDRDRDPQEDFPGNCTGVTFEAGWCHLWQSDNLMERKVFPIDSAMLVESGNKIPVSSAESSPTSSSSRSRTESRASTATVSSQESDTTPRQLSNTSSTASSYRSRSKEMIRTASNRSTTAFPTIPSRNPTSTPFPTFLNASEGRKDASESRSPQPISTSGPSEAETSTSVTSSSSPTLPGKPEPTSRPIPVVPSPGCPVDGEGQCVKDSVCCNDASHFSICVAVADSRRQRGTTKVFFGSTPRDTYCDVDQSRIRAGEDGLCTPKGKMLCMDNGLAFMECFEGGVMGFGSLVAGTVCDAGVVVAA